MDHNGTQGQGNGYRSNGEGYRASGPQGGSYSRGAEGYGGRDDDRGEHRGSGYGGRSEYRGGEYGGPAQGGYRGNESYGGPSQGGYRGGDYRGNESNTTYAQSGYTQGGYAQGGYSQGGYRGGEGYGGQSQGGYAQGGYGGSQGATRGGQGRDSFQERPEDSDAVVKVIEVLAQSEQGWDDAARRAVEQASHSVRNIRSLYIKDMQAVVRDGRIAQYRITAKLSFVLDGSDQQHDDRGRPSRMR